LSCCGIVEPDQRFAIHPFLQDRKIQANGMNIKEAGSLNASPAGMGDKKGIDRWDLNKLFRLGHYRRKVGDFCF
jgi:hypothetical protein